MKNSERKGISSSFVTGAVALIFMATGYQTALFVSKASALKIVADKPDTVYVYRDRFSNDSEPELRVENSKAAGTTKERVKAASVARAYESFPFNPNTASQADLQRLGFSPKQAESIINYRNKGGRFHRPGDFAKSFVVADTVYERLEQFIVIPKIDINTADSTEFTALPGIGKYYAAKIVAYRNQLKGYSYPEQLMDLYRFDEEKFNSIKDLITIKELLPYPLWELPEDSLATHPYIGRYSAHSIVVYRENNPKELWTVDNLAKAGLLKKENEEKLSKCLIAKPDDAICSQ